MIEKLIARILKAFGVACFAVSMIRGDINFAIYGVVYMLIKSVLDMVAGYRIAAEIIPTLTEEEVI